MMYGILFQLKYKYKFCIKKVKIFSYNYIAMANGKLFKKLVKI